MQAQVYNLEQPFAVVLADGDEGAEEEGVKSRYLRIAKQKGQPRAAKTRVHRCDRVGPKKPRAVVLPPTGGAAICKSGTVVEPAAKDAHKRPSPGSAAAPRWGAPAPEEKGKEKPAAARVEAKTAKPKEDQGGRGRSRSPHRDGATGARPATRPDMPLAAVASEGRGDCAYVAIAAGLAHLSGHQPDKAEDPKPRGALQAHLRCCAAQELRECGDDYGF